MVGSGWGSTKTNGLSARGLNRDGQRDMISARPPKVPTWHNGWGQPTEGRELGIPLGSTTPRRTGWGMDSHRPDDERQRAPASLFSSLGMPPPSGQGIMAAAVYSPRWEPTAAPGFAQHLLPKRPGHIAAQLGMKTGRPILPDEKLNPMWSPRQLKCYQPAQRMDPINGISASEVKSFDPSTWQTSNERAFAAQFALLRGKDGS